MLGSRWHLQPDDAVTPIIECAFSIVEMTDELVDGGGLLLSHLRPPPLIIITISLSDSSLFFQKELLRTVSLASVYEYIIDIAP